MFEVLIMRTKLGRDMFYSPLGTFKLQLIETKCNDPYGCLCHKDFTPCPVRETSGKFRCLDPIVPEEFCEPICGAYVTYKPGTGPHLSGIEKKLKDYQVDTYVSRVKDYLGTEVVQVVFSEKEFTGKSIEDAEKFLQDLKHSNAENVQVFKSGNFYEEATGSSVGIVFGTLVAVVIFFGILFYVQNDNSVTVILGRLVYLIKTKKLK